MMTLKPMLQIIWDRLENRTLYHIRKPAENYGSVRVKDMTIDMIKMLIEGCLMMCLKMEVM